MSNVRRVVGLVSVLLFLSACGGGGSGDGGSGGGTQPTSFTVSTSTTGTGSGTISPTSRSVAQGSTTSFTISPASGSSIGSVSGCGGSLSGSTYTTGPISGSCTVFATFDLDDNDNSANRAPVASASNVQVDEGYMVESAMTGTDPDGDSLTYVITSWPRYGTLQFSPESGAYQYSAELGSPGSDSFMFVVYDGSLYSSDATVNVSINRAPQATDGWYDVEAGASASGQLEAADPDGDSINYSIAYLPSSGQIRVNETTGEFTYTSDLSAGGSDEMGFNVSDSRLRSNTATVSFSIYPRLPIEVASFHNLAGVMSVDIHGEWAVVGVGEFQTEIPLGAVQIYKRQDDGTWSHYSTLQAPQTYPNEVLFGGSVAIWGETLVTTSLTIDDSGTGDRGVVYIYERTAGGIWELRSQLTSPEAQTGDLFGNSDNGNGIELQGNLLLVGQRSNNAIDNSGAVFFFERDTGGDWQLRQTVPNPDGPVGGHEFGIHVYLNGSLAAIGARSGDNTSSFVLYLYAQDNSGLWALEKTIGNDDLTMEPGGFYGAGAAALSADNFFVASFQSVRCNDGQPSCDAVHVLTRQSGQWIETQRLVLSESDPTISAASIDAFENRLLVGISGKTLPQAVYFKFDESNVWSEVNRLTGTNATNDFGGLIAIDQQYSVISNYSSAHIFDLR